jgi:hypothetical protein
MTPEPFVAACDKFVYVENITTAETPAVLPGTAAAAAFPLPAAKLKGDTALVNLLRKAVEAASDDDGWADLANVGHIITKQRSNFDQRSYGYAKLNELVAATTLFDMQRRSPGDGKSAVVYVRDKRRTRQTTGP